MLQARRDKVIAGALGRRFRQDWRFDIDESVAIEVVADGLCNAVAQQQRFLDRLASYVEEAVFESQIFVRLRLVGQFKRRRFRLAEQVDLAHGDFDLAGRQIGVDLVAAACDFTTHGDDELAAQILGDLMRFGVRLGIETKLCDAAAIAEVDKDHAAEIAEVVHPSGQEDRLADVAGAQGAAIVCPFVIRQCHGSLQPL